MYRSAEQPGLHRVVPSSAAPASTPAPLRGMILFHCPHTAEALVAGLPAAARVVHAAAQAGLAEVWVEAGRGWTPSEALRTEVERLRGAMAVRWPGEVRRPPHSGQILLVAGEALPDPGALTHGGAARRRGLVQLADAADPAARRRLEQARDRRDPATIYSVRAREILLATGKPTDGLVSRHLNRPLSRAVSGLLLRIPDFRPGHATALTALVALAMFAALVLGGAPGLVAGAVLFQAASVIDGVDGEAARATFRASERGALLDSMVDAGTNLAFVLGLVVNLGLRHFERAAELGAAGLVMLALGLFLIGRRARAAGGAFTFDGVKHRLRTSPVGRWLVWLTMRDFLAFGAAILVILGLAQAAVTIFAGIMAGWLLVVIATEARQTGTQTGDWRKAHP